MDSESVSVCMHAVQWDYVRTHAQIIIPLISYGDDVDNDDDYGDDYDDDDDEGDGGGRRGGGGGGRRGGGCGDDDVHVHLLYLPATCMF